jgi:hypothetical protein
MLFSLVLALFKKKQFHNMDKDISKKLHAFIMLTLDAGQ